MSVRIVSYETGGFEVDVRLRLPNGQRYRERKVLTDLSKSAAKRWGQDRQQYVLQYGPPQPTKEVPTLKDFAPRFLDGHARANQQKPSGIAAKKIILNVHLIPLLGAKRLDEITNNDVKNLKAHLQVQDKAPKTVNNVLTVLNTLLKKAVEWDVIEAVPCTIKLLKVSKPAVSFYDFGDYERLLKAAKEIDSQTYLIILLAGEAGLRSGEMVALEWSDVDLSKPLLCVQRNVWEGHVDSTKGGRHRYVPMTGRLVAALREVRHLRGPRVLYRANGKPFTEGSITWSVRRAARRAGVQGNGPHRLRHTFCSHLAMRGAAPKAIQELAGHSNFTTTQRYMHLSPNTLDSAIRLLEPPATDDSRGDSGETEVESISNSRAANT